MATQSIPQKIKTQVLRAQGNEITEYHIYTRLAGRIKNEANRKVLLQIAGDEERHYRFWEEISGRQVKPRKLIILFYYLVSRIFGLTFGIKLMERGEESARINYEELTEWFPAVADIISDEDKHEKSLITLLNEELLNYIGSIVLGLNDALVELTGALAGFTFALQNSRLIVLAGLITGIAASFSMAASEYLSNKSEGVKTAAALKSSLYTGVAYIITVVLLVLPFLLISNFYICLAITLGIAILIIFLFNYYISVVRDYCFRKRFLEMAGISLGVALLSFGIGWLIRSLLGIEI